MKAGIYVRVSTSQQVDRESLKFQEERLREYCKSQGYSVHKIYREEGVSAKDTNRPRLSELMNDAKAGDIQVVVVTKLDRITRSLKDMIGLIEFFQQHDAKLVSITQNIDTTGPMGRFILNILGAVAQVEREIDSERVSEHMHHRALSGKWNGGPVAFGFVTKERIFKDLKEAGKKEDEALRRAAELCPESKKLYIDEREGGIVKKIYDYYLRFKSIRKVTHLLNKEGIKTRRGRPWATPSIARMLNNLTYTGKAWYGKRKTDMVTGKLKKVSREKWKIVAGEHKGIISEELFGKVQDLLRQKYVKPSRAERPYLLKGLLRCGLCNGIMFAYTYHKKTPKGRVPYLYYRCQNSVQKGDSVCRGMNLRGEDVEKSVVETILSLSENGKFLEDRELMMKTYFEELGTAKPDIEEEKNNLLLEEKKLEDKKSALLEKLEDRIIDDTDFTERYEAIKKELESIHDRMAQLASKGENVDAKKLGLQISFDELSNLKKTWPGLSDEAKQLKLQAIIDRITARKTKDNNIKLTTRIFLDSLNSKNKSGLVEVLSRRGRGS
ncbi:MAG: recombinase family protein [Candidatus Omnitrophota bacterium]